MIRTTLQGTSKRRIAVIRIPRPQSARLGSVGAPPPPAYAWTTVSDEDPSTADNWQSYVLMNQARARETTPGTLNYTPASDTPAPNVAPWNSWLMPNCGAGSATPAPDPGAAAAAAPADYSKLWLLIGLVGAAASLTYLANSAAERGR